MEARGFCSTRAPTLKTRKFLTRVSDVIGDTCSALMLYNIEYMRMTIILLMRVSSNFICQSLYKVHTKTVLKFPNMVPCEEFEKVTEKKVMRKAH